MKFKYLLLAAACACPLSAHAEDAGSTKTTADNVTLALNASNPFDVLGLVEVDAEFIPSSGVVAARTINPRTVSASLRFSF